LLSWSVGLGVVLLAASVLVAGLAVHSPSRAGTPADSTSPNDRRSVATAFVDVEGGVRSLYPVQHGRVVSVPVKEGQEVEEGTVLLQVDNTLALAQQTEAEIALDLARKRLVQAQQAVEQHKYQVQAQQEALDRARQRKAAAQIQAEKAKRFQANRLGGIQKEDVTAAAKLVAETEASIRAEQARLKAVEAVKPEVGVELAQLDVKASEKQLDKAKYAVRQHTVYAPCKGQLLRCQVTVGEVLGENPKYPILQFCPSVDRIVRAEVEQEFAGRVRLDQKALIRDDATGGGEWHGTVTRLSDWYAQRRSVLLEPLQFNDVRTLEVIIRLEKSKEPLRIGQRVLVTLDK
jgi:multidrug resistance efflux pump